MAIQEIAKRCQRPIPLNLFDVNTERWLFSSGLKETTRRQEAKKTGEGGGQPEVCELVEKRVSNRLYKLERASCAQLSSYLSDWANSSRIHQRRGGGERFDNGKGRCWKISHRDSVSAAVVKVTISTTEHQSRFVPYDPFCPHWEARAAAIIHFVHLRDRLSIFLVSGIAAPTSSSPSLSQHLIHDSQLTKREQGTPRDRVSRQTITTAKND